MFSNPLQFCNRRNFVIRMITGKLSFIDKGSIMIHCETSQYSLLNFQVRCSAHKGCLMGRRIVWVCATGWVHHCGDFSRILMFIQLWTTEFSNNPMLGWLMSRSYYLSVLSPVIFQINYKMYINILVVYSLFRKVRAPD